MNMSHDAQDSSKQQLKNFSVGGLYFWIRYADCERLLLVPESVVFLGKNLEANISEDTWYFQDSRSYYIYGPETYAASFDREVTEKEFVNLASVSPPTALVTLQKNNPYQMVDCEGLARAALECAMRRAAAGKPA